MIGTWKLYSAISPVLLVIAGTVCRAAESSSPAEGQELVWLIVVTNNATTSDGRYLYPIRIGAVVAAKKAKDGVHLFPDSKRWIKEQYVEPLTASAVDKCRKNGASEEACLRAAAYLAAQEAQKSAVSSNAAAARAEKAREAADAARTAAKSSADKAPEDAGRATQAKEAAETAATAAKASADKAQEGAAQAKQATGAAEVAATAAARSAGEAKLAAVQAVAAMRAAEEAHRGWRNCGLPS